MRRRGWREGVYTGIEGEEREETGTERGRREGRDGVEMGTERRRGDVAGEKTVDREKTVETGM